MSYYDRKLHNSDLEETDYIKGVNEKRANREGGFPSHNVSGIPHENFPKKTNTQNVLERRGVKNSWQQLADNHSKNYSKYNDELQEIFKKSLDDGTAKLKSGAEEGFFPEPSNYDFPEETAKRISELDNLMSKENDMYQRALASDSYGVDIYHRPNLPASNPENYYSKEHREGTLPIRGASDSELIDMLGRDATIGFRVPEWGYNVDYNAQTTPLGYFDVEDYFKSTNPHKHGRKSNEILHEAVRRYAKSKEPNPELAKALKEYGYSQEELDGIRSGKYKF